MQDHPVDRDGRPAVVVPDRARDRVARPAAVQLCLDMQRGLGSLGSLGPHGDARGRADAAPGADLDPAASVETDARPHTRAAPHAPVHNGILRGRRPARVGAGVHRDVPKGGGPDRLGSVVEQPASEADKDAGTALALRRNRSALDANVDATLAREVERPNAGDGLSGRHNGRIADVDGDVARALVALAAANAHGTVALDPDVDIARGDGDVALSVMYEGHPAGIRALDNDIGASNIDVNVAFLTPVSAPDSIEIPPSILVVVHTVDAEAAGDIDLDVPNIEGEVAALSPRIEKGYAVCGPGFLGLDGDGAVPHGDLGLAAAEMVAQDSIVVDRAANVYVDIPDIDVDVTGAAMAGEHASGPGGIDLDVGVPHGDIQVSLAALDSNDAGPPSAQIDIDVADDEAVVPAELPVRVISVAAIAVDGVRA